MERDLFIGQNLDSTAFWGASTQINYPSYPSLRRIVRFMMVGLAATLIDISIFTALHVLLGVSALAANTISYSAGIVSSYILHRRWTYADRPCKTVRVQFLQFAAIGLTAMLMNNLLVMLFTPYFSALFVDQSYSALLAKLCATGVGLCWNFPAQNFWTFNRRRTIS